MSTFDVVASFGYVVEVRIFYADIVYMLVVIQSDDKHSQTAFLAGYIFQVYIAHGRSEATVALFPVLILQIDA